MARYDLPRYDDRDRFDEPLGDRWRFTAQDYTLAVALDLDHNRDAEAIVRGAVRDRDPALCDRLEFDSEMGCFFAYADTRADIDALADVVAELVAKVNPDAVPGTMEDSPAFFRPWELLLEPEG